MKYVRFEIDGRNGYGLVEGNTVRVLNGSYFERFSVTSETLDLNEVRLLSPCLPTKIVCVGLNYAESPMETHVALLEEPYLFVKPSESVIGPEEAVVYPGLAARVDYEAQLAVVIGRMAHNIEPEDAADYIFGYTCLSDVTARDYPKPEEAPTPPKELDTFCPVGPWIVDNVGDPNRLSIEVAVNEKVRQQANTSQSVMDVHQLVSLASKVMTLNVGDVVGAGAPGGIGPVRPGDVVEVRIQNIGWIRNPFKR